MAAYLPLLGVLIALLAGLIIGKAWERYKLRDGRWIDRRRLRETPHYMLGLNFLVDHKVDQAIDELTHAASTATDALEIQMILGNLYRQKGQVARAITVHQSLLQRPDLRRLEHAYVLLCLGLDYRHAGFVDRALEAFQEVLTLDPQNAYALANLQKLHEEQHRWAEALQVRERIAAIETSRSSESHAILGFLRNQIAEDRQKAGETAAAAQAFRGAIDDAPRTVPAYLNLGDLREKAGDTAGAIAVWEQLVRENPDRAYLAFHRLRLAYDRIAQPGRFVEFCRELIAANQQDWRARLSLSQHYAAADQPRQALDLLFEALPNNPHGLVIHQAIWEALRLLNLDPALARRYVDLARRTVFYLDPHVCTRCRYRSTELLWQCPQCHEWNTFVEERIGPAKDVSEMVPNES